MPHADDVARAVVERGEMPISQQVAVLNALRARLSDDPFGLRGTGIEDLTQAEQDALLFQWWQLRRAGEADGR